MSTDASTIPRWGLPLTPPRPRVMGEFLSTYDSERRPAAPAGEGRPVMLIPGFMAGDQSLTRMAVWLRIGGFVLARRGEACLDGAATQIEVDVSHPGMGMAREVWLAVADQLGETVTATV